VDAVSVKKKAKSKWIVWPAATLSSGLVLALKPLTSD